MTEKPPKWKPGAEDLLRIVQAPAGADMPPLVRPSIPVGEKAAEIMASENPEPDEDEDFDDGEMDVLEEAADRLDEIYVACGSAKGAEGTSVGTRVSQMIALLILAEGERQTELLEHQMTAAGLLDENGELIDPNSEIFSAAAASALKAAGIQIEPAYPEEAEKASPTPPPQSK